MKDPLNDMNKLITFSSLVNQALREIVVGEENHRCSKCRSKMDDKLSDLLKVRKKELSEISEAISAKMRMIHNSRPN